ncbi:MAG: sugar transferase [Patescibacteria group bacterium]
MRSRTVLNILLLFGDILLFYLALYLTILVRYEDLDVSRLWRLHLAPFTGVFLIWLFVLAAGGMYEKRTQWNLRSLDRMLRLLGLGGIIALIIFYAFQSPRITPKTNLVIDLALTAIFLVGWRYLFYHLASQLRNKILFLGTGPEVDELKAFIKERPHLGFTVAQGYQNNTPLEEYAVREDIDLVVISEDHMRDPALIKTLYKLISQNVGFADFPAFYEELTGKVPVSIISEAWFLENLTENKKQFVDGSKRFIDIVLAVILLIPAVAILPFVAFLIKLDSPGPIFFRQKRVGQRGLVFDFIKFRSMINNAERMSAHKAGAEERVTRIGRLLRKSYIDELGQIINVLKGEMSFIGPRPERPEFVEVLDKKVPFYRMRLLVRPGITGLAQVSMDYDASVEDAQEKLQYDLYYIKNRSLLLDLSIMLKTIPTILSRSGR